MVKFSVIIPTYNQAHLLIKCLDSLLKQTYTGWEAIVINNYSTDNTLEVLDNYNDKRIKYINFNNDGIIAKSRNIGIKNSTGEWICFLDSDDQWTPNKLEAYLPYLNEYDLIYSNMLKMNSSGKIIGKLIGYSINKQAPLYQMLLNGNPIINSSVAVKKSILDMVGTLSENVSLVGVEDFDYWLRITKYSSRFKFIRQNLGYYYVGEGNMSIKKTQILKMSALYKCYLESIEDINLYKEIKCRLRYRQARWLQLVDCNKLSKLYLWESIKSKSLIYKIKSLFFLIVK